MNLIKDLTVEDGWDCAIGVLKDTESLIRDGSDRAMAVRDLIRIEVERWHQWREAHPLTPTEEGHRDTR